MKARSFAPIVFALLAACSSPSQPAPPSAPPAPAVVLPTPTLVPEFTIQGRMATPCDQSSPEALLTSNVEVLNEQDQIIGKGIMDTPDTSPLPPGLCGATWHAPVPRAETYTFRVDGQPFPGVSFDDMVQGDWQIGFSFSRAAPSP